MKPSASLGMPVAGVVVAAFLVAIVVCSLSRCAVAGVGSGDAIDDC
jgi:hypothetical protein